MPDGWPQQSSEFVDTSKEVEFAEPCDDTRVFHDPIVRSDADQTIIEGRLMETAQRQPVRDLVGGARLVHRNDVSRVHHVERDRANGALVGIGLQYLWAEPSLAVGAHCFDQPVTPGGLGLISQIKSRWKPFLCGMNNPLQRTMECTQAYHPRRGSPDTSISLQKNQIKSSAYPAGHQSLTRGSFPFLSVVYLGSCTLVYESNRAKRHHNYLYNKE
jgi:hypothetical protein